ncbi:MAG: methyltransferase domain-containing protein [Leptolyngbya sp. SIO3F4]|nr:methyltransferase domain-containing protein [Leptolyngbya sp. SIO3F4]
MSVDQGDALNSLSLSESDIKAGLQSLEPDIPWAHYFDLGHGIETVTPAEEKFYKKAVGLKKLADLLIDVLPRHSRRGSLEGLRVLDLASAEGGHSIALARAGANVLGVEGRQLYVDRATFAAKALGSSTARFEQGDVRKLTADQIGTFEFVLFSGILHHLGRQDFEGMLATLSTLVEDTLFIYTHVSTPASIKRFNLQGPVKTDEGGYEGYLFREHKDNASDEERKRKVRASLDNTFSFWASEYCLVKALKSVGFTCISKLLHPHLFGWEEASYRVMLIARK